MELIRLFIRYAVCAGLLLGLGYVNIWLGILAMPIVFEFYNSLSK